MSQIVELIPKPHSGSKLSVFRLRLARNASKYPDILRHFWHHLARNRPISPQKQVLGWVLNTLWFGIREPFKKTNYIYIFLVSFFVFFALFVFIPVWTVLGNTLETQLDIFTARDYAVLVLLSFLSSLFITMQVYVMRQKRKIGGVGTAAAGGVGALFAGIAGTAFCVSCLAPLFALFGIGFGGVIFVLEHRFYFVAGITLLMLSAVYVTARKIHRVCNYC